MVSIRALFVYKKKNTKWKKKSKRYVYILELYLRKFNSKRLRRNEHGYYNYRWFTFNIEARASIKQR